MISGRQIREARALLQWSVTELHTRANVPESIIRRAESVDGTPSIMLKQGNLIQQAFERAGVDLAPENGGGAGVRLRKTS